MAQNFYLSKYSYCKPQLNDIPANDTGMIIVVPCFNEPGLIATLESLWDCDPANSSVEVIIVINQPENCSEEIADQNNLTFEQASEWIKHHTDQKLRFHITKAYDLPKKHAGVGLARKIGMDEAVHRFELINKPKGIIVCFDADSTCDSNYLVEIEKHFENNPSSPGCSIYFEHPLNGTVFTPEIYEGIVNYELFLRYYNQGLRYAGFPYAFHTIGSSMAVRSETYQKQGGMNKRKAGEDFYFLHKIIPLGNFTEITTTKVIPSPRPSDRVPFGTGKSIQKWLIQTDKQFTAYNFQTFADLRQFINKIEDLHTEEWKEIQNELSENIVSFLNKNNIESHLKEIKQNSSSADNFTKRFYSWFDGFMVLKYVHYSRDNFYPDTTIINACNNLLEARNISHNYSNALHLLEYFRKKEGAKKEDPLLMQKRISIS